MSFRSCYRYLAVLTMVSCGSVRAEEAKVIEEPASALLPIIPPSGKLVFEELLQGHYGKMKVEGCPLDWKKIDDELQWWFDDQKSKGSSYFKANQDDWLRRIAETKKEARKTLSPISAHWEKSIDRVIEEFNASENVFYEGKPMIKVQGIYRYYEGKRDPSGIESSWILDKNVNFINTSEISGDDAYDSGAITLKIPTDLTSVVNVRFKWSLSFKANIDHECKAGIVGYANRPDTNCSMAPVFSVNFDRSQAESVKQYSKDTIDIIKTPIGGVTLSIGNLELSDSFSIGGGANLTLGVLKGRIEAGKDLPASE